MIRVSSRENIDVEMVFQDDLDKGERLLWTGKPSTKVVFHLSDRFLIPFSLMWGGFAIFWEAGVSGLLHFANSSPESPSFFMQLWGIPFVLIGQYMIWGRFFYSAYKKSNTYYAITNKRVMVLSLSGTRKLMERYINTLDTISFTLRSDGIGSIYLTNESSDGFFSNRKNSSPVDSDLNRLSFLDIPDARSVYESLRSLRKNSNPEQQSPTFANADDQSDLNILKL